MGCPPTPQSLKETKCSHRTNHNLYLSKISISNTQRSSFIFYLNPIQFMDLMARKKVKLAFITNDASRRATFRKRKRGLMKKVDELSTLCDVNACAIVYGPYDTQPETWPASYAEAHRIMARFKDLPVMEQSNKMINQEGFLRPRIDKMEEQLQRQQRENRGKEIAHLMYQSLASKSLHDVCSNQLSDLVWMIEGKMKAVLDRMEGLRNQDPAVTVFPDPAVTVFPPSPPPPPPLPPYLHHQNGGTVDAVLFNNINGLHQLQQQQSFGGEQHQQEQEQEQHQQEQHQQQNKTENELAIEALQRQTCFMEQMEDMNNPHEQMGNYFGDHSHHQEQNTQQVAGAAALFNDHNNNNDNP